MEIGRLLLTLAAFSLMTMPITEHLWAWDHYLDGGRDFEFGVIELLIILCLVLVLTGYCKQRINLLFSLRRLISFICNDRLLPESLRKETIPVFIEQLALCPFSGMYFPPLQI